MQAKSYDEINDKLSRGEAVVLTAMEFKDLAREFSPAELVREVDVVTTATFAPMCSSGVFLNFGHADPPIRMEEISLNGVPAYEGLAAVDAYLGATAEDPGDPGYGGAHVIEALVRGEEVRLFGPWKGHGLLSPNLHGNQRLPGQAERGLVLQSPQLLPELRRGRERLRSASPHLYGPA